MIENFIAPLVVAALIGLVVFIRRWLKRGDPLAVTGEIIVPKAWQLALPTSESLPSHVPEDKRTYWPMYWLLRNQGAADFKTTNTKILVENRSEQPLTITNITVRKTQEGAPFSAAWVRYPQRAQQRPWFWTFCSTRTNPRHGALPTKGQPSVWSARVADPTSTTMSSTSRPEKHNRSSSQAVPTACSAPGR